MNAVLVDSSVVLDVFTADPIFGDRSLRCLAQWGAKKDLLINEVIFSEVSVGFLRLEDLEAALSGAGFRWSSIPREALFLAGKAFVDYNRRGGAKLAPLPDFFIGAHAAISGIPLITRDPDRVKTAYPRLTLIEP